MLYFVMFVVYVLFFTIIINKIDNSCKYFNFKF